MKPGSIKVVTQNSVGKTCNMEYLNAEHKTEGGWLLITCEDADNKARLLCRVPLANVVQILEVVPKPS